MKLAVRFEEQEQRLDCDFGEVHEIADAEGYGKGYNEGKRDGYAEGYGEGESAGRAAGFENGKQVGYDEGFAAGAGALYSCLDGTLEADLQSDITALRDYALMGTGVTNASFPKVTKVGVCAFYQCKKLISVSLPSVTKLSKNNIFKECVSLKNVSLPEVTQISEVFGDNPSLEQARFPKLKYIAGTNFNRCTALEILVLDSTTICTLAGAYALRNTPIASGTGYIYVPRDLVESYKTATNWATYANQFRAIEDYPDICGEVTA